MGNFLTNWMTISFSRTLLHGVDEWVRTSFTQNLWACWSPSVHSYDDWLATVRIKMKIFYMVAMANLLLSPRHTSVSQHCSQCLATSTLCWHWKVSNETKRLTGSIWCSDTTMTTKSNYRRKKQDIIQQGLPIDLSFKYASVLNGLWQWTLLNVPRVCK